MALLYKTAESPDIELGDKTAAWCDNFVRISGGICKVNRSKLEDWHLVTAVSLHNIFTAFFHTRIMQSSP